MKRLRRFRLFITLGAGVLLVGLCGTCTFRVMTSPEGPMLGLFPLLVGGAPTLLGLGLIADALRRLIAERSGGE